MVDIDLKGMHYMLTFRSLVNRGFALEVTVGRSDSWVAKRQNCFSEWMPQKRQTTSKL